MSKFDKQPSEEQEIANAAYVWRRQVQLEFAEAMHNPACTPEEAYWRFERYRRASRREKETEAEAKRVRAAESD